MDNTFLVLSAIVPWVLSTAPPWLERETQTMSSLSRSLLGHLLVHRQDWK
jgi:hypothetical protein